MTEFQRPARLDPARHDRAGFDSGEATLDRWIRQFAGQSRRQNTAATWVIADADGRVAAFVSLAMSAIAHAGAPDELAKHAPDPVPALLIGRLAVDHRYTSRGLGTALVAHVLATAVELNEQAACKAVAVTAVSSIARRWWERLGFHPFDPASHDLYLLTTEIEKTMSRLRRS